MSVLEAPKYDDKFWERLGGRPRRAPLVEFTEEVDLFVARRVKAARVHAGLRQEDLAAAVGLTVTQVSRLERGYRSLTVPELLRIAMQTRRPASYFIEPPDPKEVVRTGWERQPARSLWDQLRDLD